MKSDCELKCQFSLNLSVDLIKFQEKSKKKYWPAASPFAHVNAGTNSHMHTMCNEKILKGSKFQISWVALRTIFPDYKNRPHI